MRERLFLAADPLLGGPDVDGSGSAGRSNRSLTVAAPSGAVPLVVVLVAVALMAMPVSAALPIPAELENVGVSEKINEQVDLDLTFLDESAQPVALEDLFHSNRPVILNLVYYTCPMLCNLALKGLTESLGGLAWTPGEEFEVVTITINPAETPQLAREKKQAYLAIYGRPAPGWHFLSDHQGSVKRLAEQLGFRYVYDEARGEFAHTAALFIMTPQGKISRYLYGIKHQPSDLRLALTEAAESKFAFSPIDRLLLFCYHYDPDARAYVPFAMNLMRASGVVVLFGMGFALRRLWRGEATLRASGSPAGAK